MLSGDVTERLSCTTLSETSNLLPDQFNLGQEPCEHGHQWRAGYRLTSSAKVRQMSYAIQVEAAPSDRYWFFVWDRTQQTYLPLSSPQRCPQPLDRRDGSLLKWRDLEVASLSATWRLKSSDSVRTWHVPLYKNGRPVMVELSSFASAFWH